MIANKTLLLTALAMMAFAVHAQVARETVVVVPGGHDKETRKIEIVTPRISAGEWVAAWRMAKEACPNPTKLSIYFVDRAVINLRSQKEIEEVDIKAARELVIITFKKPDDGEQSAIIVKAKDLVRIEISKEPVVQPTKK